MLDLTTLEGHTSGPLQAVQDIGVWDTYVKNSEGEIVAIVRSYNANGQRLAFQTGQLFAAAPTLLSELIAERQKNQTLREALKRIRDNDAWFRRSINFKSEKDTKLLWGYLCDYHSSAKAALAATEGGV